MRSNYKKLGNYIELVSCLNTNLQYGEVDVRGVSNSKKIIQTKANNEGRDFNIFYVVKPNEFIYNSRTSRMGEKVGLGYNETEKTFITSFNNTVFRVKNEELLPKYLFMWFNRPEFDRYVRFHSWGSSTEIFSWEEMCNTLLPIPHISKQHEIVKEYNVIQNRITLNQQLIQKLEETAQAIYKQWFVDFEFPNEDGKPYKSNGGEMLESEELEKEIPKGWNVGKLADIATIIMGQSPEGESYNKDGVGMIFYQGRTDFGYRFPEITTFTTQPKKKALKNDILISVRAPVGDLNIAIEDCSIGRGVGALRSKFKCNSHLFYLLQKLKSKFDISDGEGTIFGSINKDDLHNMEVVYSKSVVKNFEKIVSPLDERIKNYSKQNQNLKSLKDLLLSKLATI